MKFLLVLLAVVAATVAKDCPVCPPMEVTVIKEVTVCEREQTSLTCPYGSHIRVHEAFYGRKNSRTCRHPSATDGSNISEACSSPSALQRVQNRCNGHRECSLSSANSWLEDPCVGTYKYLEVSFSCSKPQINYGGK